MQSNRIDVASQAPEGDLMFIPPVRIGGGLPLVLAALVFLSGGYTPAAADSPRAQHPNLLLNRKEIDEVKAKIKQYPWAARLFDRVKKLADDNGRTSHTPREAALVYALTGDTKYAAAVRRALVSNARYRLSQYEKLDLKLDPDFGAWGPWATWAWAYDLTYETFSEEERRQVERLLRTAARTIIEGLKLRSTTPNLVFEKHWKVGIVGYCLGDKELIDWALKDPGHHGPQLGGFYSVLDTMIKDGHFWGEAPIYALHYDIHGMLALAEAARHYDGTDLYRHVSAKSGGSIKKLIDGYLLTAFPLEKSGVRGGSLRMATFGDGSTSYGPQGELFDTFLMNPVSGTFGEVTLNGELEIAYKRYKDPGYAWLLSLNPERDSYIGSAGQGHNRPVWGYIALTHGEPLPEKVQPPAAPSGVFKSQGFAMLRSDDSPRYWQSGGLAAFLRLGALVGHGHKDYFHLILHGKGRLLYPDLNIIQYEPTYLNWTHEGIAHNTLLVDRQSPRPGPFTTRQHFSADAKFFALSGSAFAGVRQTRALLLTPDYMADVFRAADTTNQKRTFDYVLHGLGRLYPSNSSAYEPTDRLVPNYWWIDNERSRRTDGPWQADWVQRSAGVTRGVQLFGKEWFEQTVGVRLTMLGAKGTHVYTGDAPLTDGPPYGRIDGNPEGSSPMIVARRKAAAVMFAAIHEPYDNRPLLRHVRRIEETADTVGLAVDGPGYSDRVLIAFAEDKERRMQSTDGESFTFQGHGYVRVTAAGTTVRGTVPAFRVRLPKGAKAAVTVNGKPQTARREGEFLVFGQPPAQRKANGEREDPAETRATVHHALLPEEMHMKAGGRREATLHLRCVGQGKARGKLRLVCPDGIKVEPSAVDVAGMSEGDEKVERLTVTAARDAAAGLHSVRVQPADEAAAAPGAFLVSVGVVLSEDKRVPSNAQFTIRAPNYTMKVDHVSGVSYYLLDADGHRRHGRIHNSNFCFGIPALERAGKWYFRYRQPCQFVWEGKNTLTVGSGGDDDRPRLRYTFQEDRIVLSLVPPTHPNREYTMWLGNLCGLDRPRHNGTEKRSFEPITADWFFFAHPIYRQGLVLIVPPKTPLSHRGSAVNFPVRAGQPVVLRFATEADLPDLVKPKTADK
jgi:hypothetical protein